METFFDVKNHPKIRLAVGGAKQSNLLEAILDTGFDGYLSLPISLAVTLGIELTAIIQWSMPMGEEVKNWCFL